MQHIVGSVVATMLERDLFLEKNGSHWALADGGIAPSPSEYLDLIGPILPDLRGVFLRGRNYDRDPAVGNADGDVPTGTYQAFALASHTHGYVMMVGNDQIDGVDSTVLESGDHHNEPRQTDPTGGTEVRPNNVTVNFFVCVNSRD